MSIPIVHLKVQRTSAHPWIYRKMVVLRGSTPPGSFVEIRDRNGDFVGRGFYNPRSEIALRILTTDETKTALEDLLAQKLEQALHLRREVLGLFAYTDAYRLVHAEGDGLSGLIIDVYGSHLVVEFFSLGAYQIRALLQKHLLRLFPGSSIHWLAGPQASRREGFALESPKSTESLILREGALRFCVSLAGQKTGYFLDQRENRRLLGLRAQDREVLDLFSYSGGFALHAAYARARRVVAVDLDENAVALARQNAELNGLQVRLEHADVFSFLRALPTGETFDTIILDPSKQARVKAEVPKALKAYHDMNFLALQHLRPGGLLLTCSCSGLVSEATFLHLLKEAASLAHCDLAILETTSAAADHPVSLHCPETRYLKAVWAVLQR